MVRRSITRSALEKAGSLLSLERTGRSHLALIFGILLGSAGLLLSAAALSMPLLGQSLKQDGAIALTRVGEVHDLAPELAANTKVHLVATVTYYDPVDQIMFIQDESGGIYVSTNKSYPVHNRDLVVVDGLAEASYRTEIALNPAIRVLGHGHRVASSRYKYRDLATGRADSRLITIRGKVRSANVEQHQNTSASSTHLDVIMADGEVQVYLDSPTEFDPNSLLDATVEITGVAGGAFDAKNQLTGIILYAAQPLAIRLLKVPVMSVQQLPLTHIDRVFQSRRSADTSSRVRVRGTITYYKKGDSAVLEEDGRGIYVQTRETSDFEVGDVVDAVGFASDREYAPSLRQASLLRAGGRQQIAPRAVSYAEAFSGAYSDNLISISGLLASQLHDAASDSLVLNIDGHLVSGYLERKVPLETFQLGSRVRITGVCRIVPKGPWREVYLFRLDMRSGADAQLISEPPWYTVRHLVELLSALVVLALAIAVWAVLLRRRVVQQTERIKRSMLVACERSRILERISSNQPRDVLLSEICASVMGLLPGSSCSYYLDSENGSEGSKKERPTESLESSIFEVALTGPGEQVIGRVVVSVAKDHTPSPERHEVFATLSELAALAMQQSLLYQGLVHHSTHDPLTELPNRRLCESRLGTALDEAKVLGSRLAVIYIDVDRFKHVNDKYGHKVGDLYLRQISARLLAQIRSADTLARVGGDEFLVVAPFTTSFDHAEALIARLQACFEEAFDLEGECFTGSASFGLARYPEHGTTADELQRNADHAMYLSKRHTAGTSCSPTGIAINTSEMELALPGTSFG